MAASGHLKPMLFQLLLPKGLRIVLQDRFDRLVFASFLGLIVVRYVTDFCLVIGVFHLRCLLQVGE